MSDTIMQPLQGIKVVDLTLAGSGPSCTKLLSEAGAEVIWVEPLKGTSTRTVHKFDFYSAGKRSVSIDLKAPEGRRFIERLLGSADVFVSNYRPKALDHLHLTYDEVKALQPNIIYATLTGFGEHGPERNFAGYDTVGFWAKSGLLQDIAERGTLVVPPVAVGDISTGLSLFGGICAALYQRSVTGKGCHVYTSLLAQAIYLNHDALIEVQYGEEYPKSRKAPRRALLNNYRCADGKWITLSIPADFDKYFHPLMKALGLSVLDTPGRWERMEDTMYESAPELVAILDDAFGRLTQDEAVSLLSAIDVPVSKVKSTADLLNDPQVLANGYLCSREATEPPEGGGNMIQVPSSPLKFDSDEYGTTEHRKGPSLGQNTEEVLREYGFSEEEIQHMKKNGTIRG